MFFFLFRTIVSCTSSQEQERPDQNMAYRECEFKEDKMVCDTITYSLKKFKELYPRQFDEFKAAFAELSTKQNLVICKKHINMFASSLSPYSTTYASACTY